MAVTSLWRVKGYIGKVVMYAMNERKTKETEIIKTDHDDRDTPTALSDLIDYAERETDTIEKQFVYCIKCRRGHEKEDMMEVKKQFQKQGGVVAYHGYQSFAEGEITPDKAHRIGIQLAKELWGSRYQVLVTTHVDKDSHIHNHFVINTVSFVDGVKFHRTNKDYYQMREVSDRLCREYGLSVIEKPQGHGKHYAQWSAEKNGEVTKDTVIKNDIDECVEFSFTVKQFYTEMEKRGYRFNFNRKYAVIFHPAYPKARRMKTLGDDYAPEAIARRISRNMRPRRLMIPPQDDPEELFFDGNRNDPEIFSNYRNVLVHFVCGFTVIRQRPDENRELIRTFSEELRIFNRRVEEQNLMLDHDLYTDDDIEKYKAELQAELKEVEEARRVLRNSLKRAVRAENEDEQIELRSDISLLTKRMEKIRKETRICDRLLADKPVIENNMEKVKEYTEKLKGKEKTGNEHFRGRG